MAMERPIFLFATGWRTGSTLLQRLLSSHRDIMIWGENRGIIDNLAAIDRTIGRLQGLSAEHQREFQSHGCQGWIAMLNPPNAAIGEASRRFLETYYRDPAIVLGKSRWGFKEVRYGSDAAHFLHSLYPEARFILLTRHPEEALASARAPVRGEIPPQESILAEAGGPRAFLEHWARLSHDFVHQFDDIPHILLKHEHVVADPEQAIEEIAHHLDLDPSGFDRRVFQQRVRGFDHPPRLTREDRRWLESDWLWNAAGEVGYAPRSLPSRSITRQVLDAFAYSMPVRWKSEPSSEESHS